MNEQPADIAAAAAPKNRFETVPLEHPIVRGETRIESLNIRKPMSGELRGLGMPEILNSDVVAMITLIPRVTEPPLTHDEANNLEPDDFAMIVGTIRGFFYTAAEKTALQQFFAGQVQTI